MPNSQVTKIERTTEGNVELTIQVAGYEASKNVQVNGYVTQSTGAYAPFRVTREIPVTGSDGATVDLEVVRFTKEELDLDPKQPTTVLTWISEVWPSMLTVDRPSGNGKTDPPPGNGKTIWTLDKGAEQLTQDSMAKLARRPW